MDPIDSDEEYEYEDVPDQVREDIRKCIMDELFPDILSYMSVNGQEKFRGMKIQHVSLELIAESHGLVKPFGKALIYDLYIMHRIFLLFQKEGYVKKTGSELVGAAIRLSKAIKKEEHAEKLKKIVKDCFVPNEVPDPDDLVPGHL